MIINYNGVDLGSYAKIIDVKRPILPPQKLSTLSIAGKSGSFFYDKKSEGLPIEVELVITGDTVTELRNNLRDFAEYIDADEPKKLIFSDEPDKYIEAIISGDSYLENFFRVGKGVITMFAPDPYYYAIDDDVFEYTNTQEQSFTRRGNADSYPTIEVRGNSGDGGSFTIITDNSKLTYTGALMQGEVLVLDSGLLTAYVVKANGEKVSAIPYLDELDFPVLTKGANKVRVVPNGATLNSYKVFCKSRWK